MQNIYFLLFFRDSGVVEIVETNSSFHLKNIHGLVIDHTKVSSFVRDISLHIGTLMILQMIIN